MALQGKCVICGKLTNGLFCFITCLNQFLPMPPPPPQKYYPWPAPPGVKIPSRPGQMFPIDPTEFDPDFKVNAVWPEAKEQAEKLGIPWNFYEALLTAAKGLRHTSGGDGLLSASIDPKGWLKLTYSGYDVKLKIVEIEVVPNDK